MRVLYHIIVAGGDTASFADLGSYDPPITNFTPRRLESGASQPNDWVASRML
jgi:hypothetical protein